MNTSSNTIIAALLLALGVAIGGYFIGNTMYNAKVALNTAEVKGLSERRVQADRANWQLSFKIAGKTRDSIPYLYEQSEANQALIIARIKESGFDDSEITTGAIDYQYYEYRDDDQKLVDERHTLTGHISLETDKVDRVADARTQVNKLIAQGIHVQNNAPQYIYTKLNDIKPDMLREATQNARVAANEFAGNAGVNVGRIRNARQGGFIVRDAGEDYGDTQKIDKNVRVVTTITFYLTD